jgi:hypothetical protein
MVKRTLPITGKKYFVLYLGWLGESKDRLSLVYPPDEADGNTGRPQPGFFRITGKKYFVLYRSQAKNISYWGNGAGNRLGAADYIKHDLQPYLPPGYPNPMRVRQHHRAVSSSLVAEADHHAPDA